MMPTKAIMADAEDRMKKSMEALGREFLQLRSGRASASILDLIKVEAYGSLVPINQVASVTVPDAHSLLIQPWDRSQLGAIIKAIQKSDLGLNPQSDGTMLRVPIPRLTEDRRREMVKMVKKMAEDAKVALRRIRGDAIKQVEKLEKDKLITEDDNRRVQKDLQEMTERYSAMVDKVTMEKEKEIMQV